MILLALQVSTDILHYFSYRKLLARCSLQGSVKLIFYLNPNSTKFTNYSVLHLERLDDRVTSGNPATDFLRVRSKAFFAATEYSFGSCSCSELGATLNNDSRKLNGGTGERNHRVTILTNDYRAQTKIKHLKSTKLNISLKETQGLRLPDEPQDRRNRSWVVEAFSAAFFREIHSSANQFGFARDSPGTQLNLPLVMFSGN
ncbi:hypothetical protein CSKR_104699 [Clonorchis sinensis]|uniref:Uncharacterized protein n=1 Tax=Clonorchis sinensis TaxID=79923 RepID=A0A3R7GHX2_CLOSI|nr:hypothetical protein CSKR_104699 [Clonorchis sinensis]